MILQVEQVFLSKDHEFFLIAQCVSRCQQCLNLLLHLDIKLELVEIFSILLAIFHHNIQLMSKILIHQLVMALRTILVNHKMESNVLFYQHYHHFQFEQVWTQYLHGVKYIFRQLLSRESIFIHVLLQLVSNYFKFSKYLHQLQSLVLDSHGGMEVVSMPNFYHYDILLHYGILDHSTIIHFILFMRVILSSNVYLSFFQLFLNCSQCQLYLYRFQGLELDNWLDIQEVPPIFFPKII